MISQTSRAPARGLWKLQHLLAGALLVCGCKPTLESSLQSAKDRWHQAICLDPMPGLQLYYVYEDHTCLNDTTAVGCHMQNGSAWVYYELDDDDQDEVVMHEYGHEIAQKPGRHIAYGRGTMGPGLSTSPRKVTREDIAFVCEYQPCRCSNPEK